MSGAARAFLAALVDYAGLFPPAALSVSSAVAEYAKHVVEPEAWMLGRFIAPAGRLHEVAVAAGDAVPGGRSWPFSVIVGDKTDCAAALAAVPAQARQVTEFESEMRGGVRVACLEAPLPLETTDALRIFIPGFLSAARSAGLGGREIFLEVPAGCDDQAVLAAIAEAAPGQMSPTDGFNLIGAKLRCGGVTAEMFPTCERVAGVIHAAARLGLPLKCTAGLHHPVRHRSAEPDVMMHGFLNVFGAGVLAWAAGLSAAELVACVSETDPRAFRLDDDVFAWRDYRVTADSIRDVRQRFLCGFGSCSFAEPRADLQDMGIL